MHRIWSVLVSCVIPFGGSGFAQALHFDAASVKMVDPISRIGYGTTGGPGTGDPGRIHFRCAMMMDWAEYRQQINAALKEMSAVNPGVIKAYVAMHQANAASAHLDARTRELIALAVSVTLRCG